MEDDKLTAAAIAAREAGMSYGQWMAQHYVPKPKPVAPKRVAPKRPEPKKSTMHEIRVCVVCGEEFRPRAANQKCCCFDCSYKLALQRGAEYSRKRRSERREERGAPIPATRECEVCGSVFRPRDIHQKCCCSDCSYERKLQRSREDGRKRRAARKEERMEYNGK